MVKPLARYVVIKKWMEPVSGEVSVRCSIHTQVSKYEKFGYGCMVTQLASTQAGIAELNNCGERSVVFLLCVVVGSFTDST